MWPFTPLKKPKFCFGFVSKKQKKFFLQISLLKQKLLRKKKSHSFVFKVVGDTFNNFYHNHLGFVLTNAQKRVMKEIRSDVLSGFGRPGVF